MTLKIVFVEAAAEPFGSSRSLFTLITHLDRSRFEPLLACNKNNALLSWVENAGLTVQPLSLPGPHDHKSDPKVRDSLAKNPKPLDPGLKERALLPLRTLRDRRKYARVSAELQGFMSAQNVDVIHCNNQPSTNQFAYHARGKRPLVQHLRDAPLTRSLQMAHLCNSCSHLFAISDFVREDAISALHLDPKKVSTLYNPIDDEFSFSPKNAAQQREKWGIEKDVIVFGIAGRIIPWKGVDRAVKSFKSLCRKPGIEEKARLVIVGTSEQQTDYERLCRDLAGDHLGKSILMLPFTKDVKKAFNGFDVVLHPILKPEGFGRVIIEGMACGAPPLGRGLGALPELIEDGENGQLFMSDDEMIQMMEGIIRDQNRLSRLKENAIQSAKRFRPTTLVQEFEKTYSSLFLHS